MKTPAEMIGGGSRGALASASPSERLCRASKNSRDVASKISLTTC